MTSLLTEKLLEKGVDVTLFATADSKTAGRLRSVAPAGYEEDREIDAKVWGAMHIAEVFEHAGEFDLIHNQFDFPPLTCTKLVATPCVTTIHGFSSPKIVPVYSRYNGHVAYVAISNADRIPELDYIATVYHGIDIENFDYSAEGGEYLLFFGRIHHDKGAKEAIEIARRSGRRLVMAGIIQDREYYEREVVPHLDGEQIRYVGSVGPELRNELLANAHALIHPINFREPFGLSIVEAMACGTPTIAFNRGSMPELITDGRDGFLVDTIDEAVVAIERLDGINRAECRRTVEARFTADHMAEGYITVYQKILDSRRLR
jgi:glycosyltransferase involved in cell wall biosynthesis